MFPQTWNKPIKDLMPLHCIGYCIPLPVIRNNTLMPSLSTLTATDRRNGLFVSYEHYTSHLDQVIDIYHNGPAICSRNFTLYDKGTKSLSPTIIPVALSQAQYVYQQMMRWFLLVNVRDHPTPVKRWLDHVYDGSDKLLNIRILSILLVLLIAPTIVS